MKLIAPICLVTWLMSLVAVAGSPVPPRFDLTKLTQGFTLKFFQPLDIPGSGETAVFVVQRGHLEGGMWAWRSGHWIVLRSLEDPSSDIALDPSEPSCQIHISQLSSAIHSEIRFKAMMFSGQMVHGVAQNLFNALSDDGSENVFMNCLIPQPQPGATEPAPMRAEDLQRAWGKLLGSIEAN